MAEASHAVFLSYASEDAGAAQKIAEALRAGGIEVFLDQSELRGGDAWDHKIRHEIHECALFIPIVSQHTQERLEGYFRHEWNLAIERAHHMARQKPFLMPVVVDGTGDREALVPDEFRAVQWTHLSGGDTPSEFVARIHRLLSPEASTPARKPMTPVPAAGLALPARGAASLLRGRMSLVIALLAVVALVYLLIGRPWSTKREASPAGVVAPTASSTLAPSIFSPPPHSIAVLPFVNMSGDKDQEYFSDGLTEEILNSLARINELQVSARTSSFSFKGTNADLATIAHKLNVASVLEGSVRRSGHNIRITAQLNNGITGFRMWAQTFDRDLGDVLKLQTEIAAAVAAALKITLLGSLTERIELGGTHNPAALDAYLRGSKAFSSIDDLSNLKSAISEYTEAIRLDPNYALAFAGRSLVLASYGWEFATGPATREFFDKAQADARAALKLAPELAEGHLALATYFNRGALDFTHANEAYERAAALAPGNSEVLADSGRFAVIMGRFDAGLAAGRRAVALDPLGPRSRYLLAQALYLAHRDEESVATFGEVISLEPDHKAAYGFRGLAYYGLGDFQSARASCETKPDNWASEWCLAVTYDKLGRHADAEAMLTKLQGVYGDAGLVEYATIYAQWGNTAKALEWLTTAMRLRSPDLAYVRTDPLLDPLRNEPRFLAIERELKFPD